MEEGVRKELPEKEASRSEGRLKYELDECLETIFCEGDCQKITGLCESGGKRKLQPADSDSPGAKLRKFEELL